MKLLIVAATEFEIAPLRRHLAIADQQGVHCAFLITGVGMLATSYALTYHLLQNSYDLVLQAGVGGSFDPSIVLGSLVFVTSERNGDLGAEDHDNYLDIFDLGLLDANVHPYSQGALVTPLLPVHAAINLPHATGLTINTVSGSADTIQKRKSKFNCQIESMEGAAFHYVCLQLHVPFAQVRAISNYVTPRDKSQWKMKEAITNLNDWLIGFIASLAR